MVLLITDLPVRTTPSTAKIDKDVYHEGLYRGVGVLGIKVKELTIMSSIIRLRHHGNYFHKGPRDDGSLTVSDSYLYVQGAISKRQQ